VLAAVVTYPTEWQRRYFLKNYFLIDPVVKKGRNASLPFAWDDLALEHPDAAELFDDAIAHGVGPYGISIPVKSVPNCCSLVSYTSDGTREAWERFRAANMIRLQQLSALIDKAARADAGTSKLPQPNVQLTPGEEQCLIWAARGKTQQEIAGLVSCAPARVRAYLDTARHKLGCVNLAHMVGIAVATGIIPARALRASSTFGPPALDPVAQ
jgi:DNA-binding CsgD family transcriptional regulator